MSEDCHDITNNSIEDGSEKLCKYCNLPIRETYMGRVRNEWEHMNGLSFCANGKHWAWPK